MIFYFKTGDKYKFSEFVNKLRKENVQSRARLTNHSDHDVIVKPEKDYSENDQNNIRVSPGETYYGGIGGFWDSKRNKWYKLVDYYSVETTKDREVRFSKYDWLNDLYNQLRVKPEVLIHTRALP